LRSRAEERAGAPVSETVRQGERALKFTQGALGAIAREALKCKSGARGLRAIISSIMVDLMYEIPPSPISRGVLISEEVLTQKEQPLLV
jgi:ATP-dependent Clp protease ATP-binding subunit ClpX